jgi:hypothetical protein
MQYNSSYRVASPIIGKSSSLGSLNLTAEETIELSTCVPPHHRAAYGILLAGRQAVAAADCAADKYPHSRAYVLLLLPVHPWLGSKLETAHHQRPNRAICVQVSAHAHYSIFN